MEETRIHIQEWQWISGITAIQNTKQVMEGKYETWCYATFTIIWGHSFGAYFETMTNLCQGSQYPGKNQPHFHKLKADIICLVMQIQGNKMSWNREQWTEVAQVTVQCWRCSNTSKFSFLWLTWVDVSWSIPSHSFLTGSLSSSISHWLCGVGGGVETSDTMLLQLAVFNCSWRLSRSSARNSWQSCCNSIQKHISICTSNLPLTELCHFWKSLNSI